jgi:hypothetical protein
VKNGVLITLLVANLFLATPAYAALAVSDSGAYAYWATQIEKAVKQIEELQGIIDKGQEIKTETINVYNTLKGNYDRAKGFMDGMNNLMGKIENSPYTTKAQLEGWIDQVGDGTFEDLLSPEDVLEAVFNDPRNPEIKIGQNHDQRFNTRQIALKDAITNADELLKSMPEMFQRVKELSEQIDQTENMKDSMDLNNRLLLELIQIQLAQLSMQMQFEKAGALVNFQGVQSEAVKERAKRIIEAQSDLEAVKWLKNELQKEGVNTENGSLESLYYAE